MEIFKLYQPEYKLQNLEAYFFKLLTKKDCWLYFYEGEPNCSIEDKIWLLACENRKLVYEGVIRYLPQKHEMIPCTGNFADQPIDEWSFAIGFEIAEQFV